MATVNSVGRAFLPGQLLHRLGKADVAWLTPLLHDHVHMLGKSEFTLSPEVALGHLRPLRDPSSLEEYLNRIP